VRSAKLKDERARALIASRLDRLAYGYADDAEPVGEGITELHIHYGPGYRIYFHKRGNTVVLLLCDGDKRAHRRKTSRRQNGLSVNGLTAKLTTYDPAEDLTSDASIATFMAEAFASEDPGYIAHTLGVVARAKSMAQIAKQTGLSCSCDNEYWPTCADEYWPTLRCLTC
jgi:putative addiction module killer protein